MKKFSLIPSLGGVGGSFSCSPLWEGPGEAVIQPRTYRQQFSAQRFRSFLVNYKETDLWIGVDPASFHPKMESVAQETVRKLRSEMEQYLMTDPEFGRTFLPCEAQPNAPEIVQILAQAGKRAGTGPMAAVAGAFSEQVGKVLLRQFNISELVIENGGDIFLLLKHDLILSVFAGKSVLSEKIGVVIPASASPLGVCTSAGTVGPSVSFGKADAVMIACSDTALADAFATAFANRVKSPELVQQTVESSTEFAEILSIVAICGDKLGIRSNFEIKLIR